MRTWNDTELKLKLIEGEGVARPTWLHSCRVNININRHILVELISYLQHCWIVERWLWGHFICIFCFVQTKSLWEKKDAAKWSLNVVNDHFVASSKWLLTPLFDRKHSPHSWVKLPRRCGFNRPHTHTHYAHHPSCLLSQRPAALRPRPPLRPLKDLWSHDVCDLQPSPHRGYQQLSLGK